MRTGIDGISFKDIIDKIPAHVYWKDLQGRCLGASEMQYKDLGLTKEEYIGKTDFDLFPKNEAGNIFNFDRLVIKTNAVLTSEEPCYGRVYLSRKVALKSKNKVVGLLGVSIDVDEDKKLEQDLKNAKEKTDELNIAALQVAHDIRSPLAAISMLAESCKEIPEMQRVYLREAVNRMQDIANGLLVKHSMPENIQSDTFLRPILVSTAVLELVSSKRLEFNNTPIKLCTHISPDTYSCFIQANSTEFKRMLSNLINNAKEASAVNGEIQIHVKVKNKKLVILVEDAGCGMTEAHVQKMISHDVIESTKTQGLGLGLFHLKKTAQNMGAQWNIKSIINQGTTVELIFDLTLPPAWTCDVIKVYSDDIIVILDDDQSIHGAWEEFFSTYLQKYPLIKILHFTQGQACIDYINSCQDKNNILLLADYELINQGLNGLDVVAATSIQRAVLVTSHYENNNIIKQAILLNTKILPKVIVSNIRVLVSDSKDRLCEKEEVDFLLLEDNKEFSEILCYLCKKRNKKVKLCYTPYELLSYLPYYSKEIKICIDYDINCPVTGIDLANVLYKRGYNNLYLATGYQLKQEDVPSYLTVLKDKMSVLNL